jgi:hypothetical protein
MDWLLEDPQDAAEAVLELAGVITAGQRTALVNRIKASRQVVQARRQADVDAETANTDALDLS